MEFIFKMSSRDRYHDYYEAYLDNEKFAEADASKGVKGMIDIKLRMRHYDYNITAKACDSKLLKLHHDFTSVVHTPKNDYSLRRVKESKNVFNKDAHVELRAGTTVMKMYHVPVVSESYSILPVYVGDRIVAVAYLDDIHVEGRSFYRIVCEEPYVDYMVILLAYYDQYLNIDVYPEAYHLATMSHKCYETRFMDKTPDAITINRLRNSVASQQ